MPNRAKNLQPTARRASAATPASRQEAPQPQSTLPPCCYCTLQAEQSLKIYRIGVHMLALRDMAEYRGGILNTDNYTAISKQEAIGMAIERLTKLHPHHCIVGDSINIQLVMSVPKIQ